jgi:hypothetical protein
MAELPKKGKGFLQVLPAILFPPAFNMLIAGRSLPVYFVQLSLLNQELKLLSQAI